MQCFLYVNKIDRMSSTGGGGELQSAGGLAFLTCQSKHSQKLHSLRGEQQLNSAVSPAFIRTPELHST